MSFASSPKRTLALGLGVLFAVAACAEDRFTDEDDDVVVTYVPSAESGPEACSDGEDNDGDGWIDCVDLDCQPGGEPNPACLPDGMPEEDNQRCADGIDNDGNGFTDCDDFSCSQNDNVTICPTEDTDELCSDDEDNDGNGFTDCDDFGCSMNPNVTVCGGS